MGKTCLKMESITLVIYIKGSAVDWGFWKSSVLQNVNRFSCATNHFVIKHFWETPVKYIPLLKDVAKQLVNIVNYQMGCDGINHSCLALELFLTERILTG